MTQATTKRTGHIIVIQTMEGPSFEINDYGPILYGDALAVQQEIQDEKSEGVDVDDWEADYATIEGDLITLHSTGETFNWKKTNGVIT